MVPSHNCNDSAPGALPRVTSCSSQATQMLWQRRSAAAKSTGIAATLFLLLILLAGGCQQAQVKPDTSVTITVAGATSMRPVLVALGAEFSRQFPLVILNITGGDSTIGEDRVRGGQVDLAASTLISPSIPSDVTAARTEQPLVRIPIGLDGLAIIVHKTNPIDNLTLAQLQELYSGRTWNWQELTNVDEEVQLVTREDGSGSRALFDERIMGEVPVALTAVVMPTSDDVVKYVAEYTGTIGYVSRAFVTDLLAEEGLAADPSGPLAQIRLVRVENQLPTLETLQNQSYFLIQPLYLVSNGQPRDTVKRFIDYTLSPAGQATVRRFHQPIR